MELSPEQDRHIRNLSVVPAALVTYILLILFIVLSRETQSFSVHFYLMNFGLPFVLLVPTTGFLSYEILCSRKTGGLRRFNARRFIGRTGLLSTGVSLFLVDFGLVYVALSPWVEQWSILLLAGVLWFGMWILIVFRFRPQIAKLEKGEW